MDAITRLVSDVLTNEQQVWIQSLKDSEVRALGTYIPGISVCPPGVLSSLNAQFPSGSWGKSARMFCQKENQKRQNNELIPAVRREEYLLPKGGSIEYGLNSVKVSVPGVRPQEFVACPLPTTIPNPDPDLVRTAAVIAQFSDIKKGNVVLPVNQEAVTQYSSMEGFVDGARVSMIPSIVADVVAESVVFAKDVSEKETVAGEEYATKVMSMLHLLKADSRFVLNWQLIVEVFRCCRKRDDGTLHFFLDGQGKKLYDKAAVSYSRASLSVEERGIFDKFKETLKYPPLKFGTVKNRVKQPEATNESFRRMIRGTMAAVGVSRGLGKILANLDYCTGQSEQVRMAAWYKAMVLICGVPPSKIDIKCGPGVAQLLLSQLKDEVSAGLCFVLGDSKARHNHASFRSERRPNTHVIYYDNGVIPSTPSSKKLEEDIEPYHEQQMSSRLTEIRALYSGGWTVAMPVSHGVVFEKTDYVYALKNNYTSMAILSTVRLDLDRHVVPLPYDYEPVPTSTSTTSVTTTTVTSVVTESVVSKDNLTVAPSCGLSEVIYPVKNWHEYKNHTIKAMSNAMSFYINPVYSCTPLGRLFRVNGTTEYAMIESELVYVGRELERYEKGGEDTVVRFEDDEEVRSVLQQQGLSSISGITSVVVVPEVAQEVDFEVDEL